MINALAEILQWSMTRPAWQRDALRRIFIGGTVTPADAAELAQIAKRAHGLADHGEAEPLVAEHLAIQAKDSRSVILESLTHNCGANALAEGQTLTFGPSLTVVFGENATGKSGYARILKQACRARVREGILGNVLSGAAPLALDAVVRFRAGADGSIEEWTSSAPASQSLAAVSVFDSHCAPVYVRDKTDVAFRPFSLDVFDVLSAACGAVKTILATEQAALDAPTPGLPVLPPGTKARQLLDTLGPFTDPSAITQIATLSEAEQSRLNQLRQERADGTATNPAKRAEELRLKGVRIEALANHLEKLYAALGPEGVNAVRACIASVQSAEAALGLVQKAASVEDLIPGTGGREWRDMWNAAMAFLRKTGLPEGDGAITAGARCPFCQQVIGADAAERLKHFAEYVLSTAQRDLAEAEARRAVAVQTLAGLKPVGADTAATVSEVNTEDSSLGTSIQAFLDTVLEMQPVLIEALRTGASGEAPELPPPPIKVLGALAASFKKRGESLTGKSPGLRPEDAAALLELEARHALNESLDYALLEIQRKKRRRQYDDCLAETNTAAITKKSTELTTKLVTDQLRSAFSAELKALEFIHLSVELKSVGGSKGALYHQVVFANAPGVNVGSVLSEGESRTLSLAAFFAELSTAEARSAIVFDDPVSSLDHVWRERIAKRLVREATSRQVIVFTHDILFLQNLWSQASAQDVHAQFQHIIRGGQVGVVSTELPWEAMATNARIGKLRQVAQDAKSTYNKSGASAYKPEAERVWGMLRESWEHAVPEVLLNDVVERYRHQIETKKLKQVVDDITTADYKMIDEAMAECSRWLCGHDGPPPDATPFPLPDELMKRIDELDDWAKSVRNRRQKKKPGLLFAIHRPARNYMLQLG